MFSNQYAELYLTGALLLATAGISYFLCAGFASHTIFRDDPNARSSHDRPTSRAGGVGVFATWAIATPLLAFVSSGQGGGLNSSVSFIGVSALAFLVGVVDDWRGLKAAHKFFYQALAAGLFVLAFGAINLVPLPFFGFVSVGLVGPFLTIFWLVAFMNAFNFMDGVNGLAGLAGIVGASGLAIAGSLVGNDFVAMSALVLCAAQIGFLRVNFPSGRIFLGDGGSLSISFILASLAVVLAKDPPGVGVSALFLPTLFAPFIFDVAITLVHRALRRQKILHGHNEHIYQLLVRLGWSHAGVASLYFVLIMVSGGVALAMLALPGNLQWIAPAAIFTALLPGALAIIYLGAYFDLLPGLTIAKPSKPGRREDNVDEEVKPVTGSSF